MSAHTWVSRWFIGFLSACSVTSGAYAMLPSDRTMVYHIHETPTDPQSGVVFTVKLKLVADEIDGADVGWRIDKATFIQKSPMREWSKTNPDVDTPDGLWWVTHADPQAPVVTEFAMPPYITGTATAEGAGYADLDYEFEGTVYVTPPQPEEPPYGDNTAAANYWFQLVGSSVAEEEGEEEPLESGDEGSE